MPNQIKIISLKPLYDFIKQIPESTTLLSVLRDKEDYGILCREIAKPVDQCQGFYLWGKYNRRGLWTNIYLGKAGFGKTAHLGNRILKELLSERMGLWRLMYSEKELLDAGQNLHQKMWGRYLKNAQRAFLKAGSTHIAWVPTKHLNNKEVLRVEADLIEAMNPVANMMRPAPPANLQADTRDIFEKMRFNIHEGG